RIWYTIRCMIESASDKKPNRSQLALQSIESYNHYIDEMFDELEAESDPSNLDLAANELLLLITRHREFSPTDRLLQLSFVSHFTMILLRRFSDAEYRPEIVHQAEMI